MVTLTAFARYDREAASTRQRLLQYGPALEVAGIALDYRPLLDSGYVSGIASGRRYPPARLLGRYARRLREVTSGPLGDVVWVYSELFPYLPAGFERLLLRRGRPLIYDFDDAFFHTYDDHPNAAVRALLGGKLEPLLRGADACTCGNAYLQDYASRFCPNAVLLPTVVDTALYRPTPERGADPPVIGWIGSPSTWPYVEPLLPLLRELHDAGLARVRVVGAGVAASRRDLPFVTFVDWSEASEIAAVQAMDIGIMPVPDEPWARGKSGYKLIQYMACGLPVVASPVGVNSRIVVQGANGFLARDSAEWRDALHALVGDVALRRRMGAEGRARAVADYSLLSAAPRFVALVEALLRGTPSRPRFGRTGGDGA